MLQTQSRFLTIVELVSKALEWDDSLQCPTRDRQTIEIVSDRLLSTVEVNAYTSRYPSYAVVGVHELDYSTAPEEF